MAQPVSKDLWGRRDFIRLGSLGAMGLCLSDFLRLKALAGIADEARSCIMIVLDGGPPQHETFDMKPDAPSDVRGTFKSPSQRMLRAFRFVSTCPKPHGRQTSLRSFARPPDAQRCISKASIF